MVTRARRFTESQETGAKSVRRERSSATKPIHSVETATDASPTPSKNANTAPPPPAQPPPTYLFKAHPPQQASAAPSAPASQPPAQWSSDSSMPTCEEAAGLAMWKSVIPSLAFECPYIYSAILGVAAQHMLSLLPDDISLKMATYQYIDETVTAHREEMSRDPSRYPLNRFTTSMLLTAHAKLRTRYEASNDVLYTPPINYFILQHGAKDIFENRDDWGADLKAYIECFSHLSPLHGEWKSPEFEFNDLMKTEFPPDPLIDFVESDISIEEERKEIYVRALNYLGLIKHCIFTGERTYWIRHRIAIAVSVFTPGFRVLMQESDPICLLILARMFALQKIVDEPWWLEGSAEYEVRGLDSMILNEWKWGMEWPLNVLENSFLFVFDEDRVMF